MCQGQLSIWQKAILEASRVQTDKLRESIARLILLRRALPEGEHRECLADEIKKLDLITGLLRKAVDCMNSPE